MLGDEEKFRCAAYGTFIGTLPIDIRRRFSYSHNVRPTNRLNVAVFLGSSHFGLGRLYFFRANGVQ